MRYVLDASVAFKWVVDEDHSPRARQLRAEFQNGIHELLAPDIFPVEVGHALTRAERQGRVSLADGWALWLEVMADAPKRHHSLPLMAQAYALSSALRVGIYDCLYVALAEKEGCELVTADDKLVKNLQASFPFITALSSL